MLAGAQGDEATADQRARRQIKLGTSLQDPQRSKLILNIGVPTQVILTQGETTRIRGNNLNRLTILKHKRSA